MAGDPQMRPINFGAEVISGFAFKSEDFSDTGIPVVKIKNVNNRLVDLTKTEFFPSIKVTEKHERFFLKDGDVLIAMTGQGSVGRVGKLRLSAPQRVLLNQRVGRFSTDPKKLDLDYLYYVISTPMYEQILFNAGSGSGQPNLSPSVICSIKIPVPTLAEQKAIAAVLGALDDKIESNRRTSRTLERVARAIFRAWFVDFEPVKAKVAGARSFPGMPQKTFKALPPRLVTSELGPVPEGWKVGCIGDVIEMRMERIDPSEETARLPYVPIECISPKSLSLQDWKKGSEAQSSLQRFYRGDILFGAMRPYFHKVCLSPFDGTTRTTAFVLIPRKATHLAYAALLVHDPSTVDYATQHSVGSTIPYAKWERSLSNMPVVIPPASYLETFEEIVRPMLEPLLQNPFENAQLRALLDYLLPKLLSGEVRVADTGETSGEGPTR